jgi:hypothetical protein
VKYSLILSRILPRQIKQVVFCFLEQFVQNVCPQGTIADEIGSNKHIEQCGSILSVFNKG